MSTAIVVPDPLRLAVVVEDTENADSTPPLVFPDMEETNHRVKDPTVSLRPRPFSGPYPSCNFFVKFGRLFKECSI